jgi:hypothetical protein
MDLHAITTTLASLVLAVQQISIQHATTSSSPPTANPVLLPCHDLPSLSEQPAVVALSSVPSENRPSSTVTDLVPTPTTPPMALVNPHATRANDPLLQSVPTFFTLWSSRLARIVQQTIHTRALRSMPPLLPETSHLPIPIPSPPLNLAQRERPIPHPHVTDVHTTNDVLVPSTQEDIERHC